MTDITKNDSRCTKKIIKKGKLTYIFYTPNDPQIVENIAINFITDVLWENYFK